MWADTLLWREFSLGSIDICVSVIKMLHLVILSQIMFAGFASYDVV